MIELIHGSWQKQASGLCTSDIDAIITDPPYSERCHAGQNHRRTTRDDGYQSAEGLRYEHLTEDDIKEFCDRWREVEGWIVILTDHILCPIWEAHLRSKGVPRYTFAPLSVVMKGMNVRLAGDGPSSWSVLCIVSRPKGFKWRTTPGAYVGPPNRDGIRAGGKPLWLMRALIRDYTLPDDTVLDPYAGGATTLIAAGIEGRNAWGTEVDRTTFEMGRKRIEAGWTPCMFE